VPAANALITLAEAKTYLGVTDDDEDDAISDMIDAASNFIEEFCSTAFIQRSFTEYLRGAQKRLFLKRYPIVSVTSVLDSVPNLIPATDYIVMTELGVLEHFGRFPQAQTAGGQPTLWTVTYVAGRYANVFTVSEDVKLAAKRLLAVFRAGDGSAQSVSVGSLSVSYWQPGQGISWVPPQVLALLAPYRANLVA